MEVTGDRGKIVVEEGKLLFWQLRIAEPEFNRTYTDRFGEPENWKIDIPIKGTETAHQGITQNFVDSIRKGVQLLAPGEEGIKGLALSNAMHLSTWIDRWVKFPIDEELYFNKLQEQIRASMKNKDTLMDLEEIKPPNEKGDI